MSSQCANAWVISVWVMGSASKKLSKGASENTTPKPKVSSEALRSMTATWCRGSARFIKIAKYKPAAPPPIATIFARDFTEAGTVNGPVSAYDGHEEGVMKTPACLPTLVSALVLMLVVGVALPSAVMAGDPLGTPARPDSGTYRDRDVPARDPAAPTVQQNEPNRANDFVDYHSKPEATGPGGTFSNQSDPANERESIGRRDADRTSQRSPFEGELRGFRGQMGSWRR